MNSIKKDNDNIIYINIPGQIYLYFYGNSKTKNKAQEELNLHKNHFNLKIEKSNLNLLIKNNYINEIGKTEQGFSIFQSTPKPLIEEINRKLQKEECSLTSFEESQLTQFLNSTFFRNIIKNFDFNDYRNGINPFVVIIESCLGEILWSEYLLKKVLFDPKNLSEIRKYISNNKDNLKSDSGFDILKPMLKINESSLDQLFLPDIPQAKQMKLFSNIPEELDFFEDHWTNLSYDLICKLYLISTSFQYNLHHFKGVMSILLPFFIAGTRYPNIIQNSVLRSIIINKRKNFEKLYSRNSKFRELIKNNGAN